MLIGALLHSGGASAMLGGIAGGILSFSGIALTNTNMLVLSVTNTDIDVGGAVCQVLVEFADRDGALIGDSELMALGPSQTDTASFALQRKPAKDEIPIVNVSFTVIDQDCRDRVTATLQVLDRRSRRVEALLRAAPFGQ